MSTTTYPTTADAGTYDPLGAAAAAQAASQPLDSDLTAIAALTNPATTITGSAQKAQNAADLASAATTRTNLDVSNKQRTFRSRLPGAGTLLAVADVAYWVYLGYFADAAVIKYVEVFQTVLGVGTQTAEVCLATTPLAPNKQTQTMTKIANSDSGTLDSFLASNQTMKRNTTILNSGNGVSVTGHVWAGIRFNLATTQPTVRTLTNDCAQGWCMQTATAGALTNAGPWTANCVPSNSTSPGPELSATMD